jgi:hypothetical protein
VVWLEVGAVTTFEIDTGNTTPGMEYVPGWFLDQYNIVPDDARVVHDWAYHLIGAVNNPKKMETVRKHLLAQWGFLRVLADVHPAVFDELLVAYGERWASE